MKFWGWFSQRVTGLILVVLVLIHVCLAYFGAAGTLTTYAVVQERMHSAIILVDLLLLYLGLYHGLYGLREVVSDMEPRLRGVTTKAFIVGGLLLSLFGTTTLMGLR